MKEDDESIRIQTVRGSSSLMDNTSESEYGLEQDLRAPYFAVPANGRRRGMIWETIICIESIVFSADGFDWDLCIEGTVALRERQNT